MEILPTNLLHLPITLKHLENTDLPSTNSENQLNINPNNPNKNRQKSEKNGVKKRCDVRNAFRNHFYLILEAFWGRFLVDFGWFFRLAQKSKIWKLRVFAHF